MTEAAEAGREPDRGPEDPAEPTSVVPVRPRASPAPAMFVGGMILVAVTFGPALLAMSEAGRTEREPEETAIPTARATATAAAGGAAQRTRAPAGGPVRVLNTSGTSTALSGGAYQVTFVWTLEGAQEGDAITVHFYAGPQLVTEREAALDPQIFAFSTGTLRITTNQQCSSAGWRADLVRVRGQNPVGETFASVAGAACR